jgi:hypothetical protein
LDRRLSGSHSWSGHKRLKEKSVVCAKIKRSVDKSVFFIHVYEDVREAFDKIIMN